MQAILTLVAILAVTNIARAEHSICSWRAYDHHPADEGFHLFCTAELRKEDDAHGRYVCKNRHDIMVADFGYLKPKTLEWATPCGGNGFAFDVSGHCMAIFWALCLGPSCDGKCLYMKQDDDCEWPTAFNQSDLPGTVALWLY